jgi:hypothetical protein
MIYTVTVEEDSNGEMVLPFPDEMMDELNWEIGDSLIWSQEPNGNIVISKVIYDGSVVVTGADSDIE